MRSYRIARYVHTDDGCAILHCGAVLAVSLSHALALATRSFGKGEYTALEVPLIPYGHDNRASISAARPAEWYPWSLAKTIRRPLSGPDYYSPSVFS